MKSSKAQILLVLAALVSWVAGGILPAIAQEQGSLSKSPEESVQGEYKSGEVLVKFKQVASIQSMPSVLSETNSVRIRTLYGTDIELWQVPDGQEMAVIEQLNSDPAVEYAEPNYVYRLFDSAPNTPEVVPDDPYYPNQWAHTRIQSPEAWDVFTGTDQIVIAIIDSGIDPNHPDLAGKIVPGYDFVDDDNNPTDENGHGTHVAGIAAAITNNGVGIAGVDWKAKIMPVRVADNEGSAYTADIIDGIHWAYQNGAKVLNLSLGGPTPMVAMQAAVEAAHNAGSLVIAAIGNERMEGNPTMYPAGYAYVMAVAATGPADQYAPYSQYGDHCDISAPGGDMTYLHDPDGIYSTMPTYPDFYMKIAQGFSQDYDYLQGTSQATPHVAGLAALVWSTDLSQTPDQVQNLIENRADDLGAPGWDSTYGYGRINAAATLQNVAPPSTPVLWPISNTDGDGNYAVEWSHASGAASYTLEEDQDMSFGSPHRISTGTETRYSFYNKDYGTTWYYRVRAINPNGNSDWSNIEAAMVAPAAPTLSLIDNEAQEDAYLISWSQSSSATSYTLVESASASCSNPRTRYSGMDRQYQVACQEGGTWYYCVRASNQGGGGSWSTPISTTVAPAALNPPTLAPIDNGDGGRSYDVNWSEVQTTPVTYTLEQANNPYFVAPQVVYSGTAPTLAVSRQTIGTWHYRVQAFGADGHSPCSAAVSASVRGWFYLPSVVKEYPLLPPDDKWDVIVEEDFEASFPRGFWEAFDDGEDLDDSFWGKRACNPYEGENSAWAVGGGWDGQNLACNAQYPGGSDSWMVYGPFSLADAQEAELVYQTWVNLEPGDTLCHMASVDGWYFSGGCTGAAFPQRSWTERMFDLTDVFQLGDLTGESKVWIAFIFTSDLVVSKAHGAYVDDVVLRKADEPIEDAASLLIADWEEPASLQRAP